MSDLQLRPRSATEIIDAAFSLYRRDFPQYIMITALAVIPSLIFQLLNMGNATTDPMRGFLNMLPAVLMSMITFALTGGVVNVFGSDAYLGRTPDLERTVKKVLPLVPVLVAASLLYGVFIGLGFIALLVGSLYVIARYFAVVQAIVIERKSILMAFARSAKLSEGHKKHILATLVLVFIIYFAIGIGMSLITGMFGSVILTVVFQTAVSVVLSPLMGLTTMVLYYDTRIRAEGFDVEFMTSQLDGSASAAEFTPS